MIGAYGTYVRALFSFGVPRNIASVNPFKLFVRDLIRALISASFVDRMTREGNLAYVEDVPI